MAYYNQAQREQAIYADATQRVFPGQQPQQQQFYPGNIPLNHPSQQSHGYFQQQQQAQYAAYGGEAMSMPPPSTMGTPMTGGSVQLGISQRPPSAPYGAHMQNSQFLPPYMQPVPSTLRDFGIPGLPLENSNADPVSLAFIRPPEPFRLCPLPNQFPTANSAILLPAVESSPAISHT